MDETLLLPIGVGVVALAAGVGLGIFLQRPGRRLRARVAELESELREARRSYDEHRARVEKHFERTSDLFRNLTEQYTALYAHLAEGARDLCPEGGPALGRGLSDPLLAATLGAEPPPGTEDLGADELDPDLPEALRTPPAETDPEEEKP